MFWIGFIVGMVVLALISVLFFMGCMKVTNTSREDFNKLVETNMVALMNRESQVEVWHDNEQIFEATFAYPWGDNANV